MNKLNLIPAIVITCCLLGGVSLGQEEAPAHRLSSSLERVEAENAVMQSQLMFKLTEFEVKMAIVDVEKLELAAQNAKVKGDTHDASLAIVELKQARIRIDYLETKSEIARLEVELAKARLEHFIRARRR